MTQSQEDSQQGIGPAVSASAEARPCDGQEMTDGDCDGEPMMQPREGTPVSSNRRHYRVSLCLSSCFVEKFGDAFCLVLSSQ